jgi:hypothetical protein
VPQREERFGADIVTDMFAALGLELRDKSTTDRHDDRAVTRGHKSPADIQRAALNTARI